MKANQSHKTNLIERCRRLDKNAQLQIYKDYYKAMYNTAFRILRDQFEAEDVMQEAFLAAFTKIEMFKGEVTFGAWLKRIVIHKSLSQLKKNNRYKEVKMEIIATHKSEEEELNYTKLKATEALKSLNSLKENYRLVLTLHLIEGYDYQEIGEILNYTNENVRTTISRAKKKLRQTLALNTKEQAYGK